MDIAELIKQLKSLGCIQKKNNKTLLNVAGMILFGSKLALRRTLSDMRIDYIRVPGKQWMDDPENRYTSSINIMTH